ncbi:DUF4082 domain-containing protein [Devosia sp. 2618]|uniref:DUF4082 domain-containing protein n=1 Tax=Devosia sp. 2618 TaxID=3156454 RepID=UPI0033916A2C
MKTYSNSVLAQSITLSSKFSGRATRSVVQTREPSDGSKSVVRYRRDGGRSWGALASGEGGGFHGHDKHGLHQVFSGKGDGAPGRNYAVTSSYADPLSVVSTGPVLSPTAPVTASETSIQPAAPVLSPVAPAATTPAVVPAPTTGFQIAPVDAPAATAPDAAEASAAVVDWRASWLAAAAQTPCGSCTGRACTMCSVRTGGPAAGNGKPTGYAPRTLIFYDPSEEAAGAEKIAPALTVPSARTDNAGTSSLTAAAAPNAIVLENQKQGTPESVWMIGKADASIEGYAAEFTLNHGQRVDFKINTDSKNYRVDIYRLGYYGGDGARLVHTINRTLTTAQGQPVPLFDPTTKLVDAGNWSVSTSWDIPADAVSGVYFAKLTRLDGSGGENMIPFIVRDDQAPSDITFQTSDTTWQAYNWWGGYNFYGGIDAGGREGRASAVSYNRPIISRDGGFSAGPQDFIFGAEYSAIRFIEQNGYDVNYISGIDSASNAAQLLNSKIFLSVGHDEYWSGEQRANVEAARDAGVNLSFWSGNEVYWETRWESSIDGTGTPYKTLVSYKERWDNANSDVNGTTSTWRDPLLGSGKPENSLTGTIFTVDSYRLDAIDVPYDMSNLRFWSNTAVAGIEPGEVYTLTKNLLGYEWDSDLDNGFRPAGLVPLSSTTVDVNSLLLDYGNAVGPGTAQHSLTLYRAPSGALVFGAGTVYWSWGLDSHHDNEATPIDRNVQQSMINLFADMGVQPTTLMQSLVAANQTTDHLAPTSIITSPTAAGALTAAQTVTITGTATDAGGGLVSVVEVSTNGGTTWHRATGRGNWTYSWTPIIGGNYTILSRAVDDSVNLETPSTGITVNVSQGGSGNLFGPNETPATPYVVDPTPVNVGVTFSANTSGSIVGLRYFKGAGNTGQHIGSLWTSTGTLLSKATFQNETASGWQTVIFDAPISITAGTTYVASYYGTLGYAASSNYFVSPHTRGALTSTNGVYTYANQNAFPTISSSGTNYWVDVVFSGAVTANDPPVGNNDNGFLVQRNTPITFSAATLLANDTDPNNDPLTIIGAGAASGGTVTFNAQAQTITFTPNAGYTGTATFGYSISDGRGGTGSAMVSMNVVTAVSQSSLFQPSDTPSSLSSTDTAHVNLGVKFVASAAGIITGIKYYKSATDVGTHTGSLWSSTGTLLASATFENETASGWQTLSFSNPVQIAAGATYTASFHSNGHYATTPNYFTTAHTNGLLTAPAAGNGVFTYGIGNVMPTSTYGNTNYWVDVVMNSTASTNQAPVATNDSGFTTPLNTALTLAASALLANDTDPDSDPLSVTGVSNAVNGTVTFNVQTNSVLFTPTAGYSGAASFVYAIADGRGGTSNATVNLTIAAAPNRPPVAGNDSGYTTAQGQALQIAAAALLGNDTDPDGDPLTITGVSGAANGTVAFNAQTNIVTFTPNAGYTGAASFNYAVADGRGGTASAAVALNVTTPITGSTVFAANATPATANINDSASVELGMRFTVASAGFITGVRFYKGAQNVGTHTGTLWSATGTQLGTVTFGNETASGWQSASFSNPIAVSAGTSYIVSYHAPNGHYSATGAYFGTATTNGQLTAPQSVTGSTNGLFTYGSNTVLPTSSYNATNYWVDVYYQQGANTAPVANNDSGLTTQRNAPLQIAVATLLANDTDANGDPLVVTGVSGATNGTVSFNPQTNIVTFTPNTDYSGAASFSYAISDGRGGTASANVGLTVAPPVAGTSLFPNTAVPTTTTVNDPNGVELGMKFTSSQAGTITGVRFYKGAQNTGTHTGTLWSSAGVKLGTLTFQNETASGWQTASFATPIAITAGTTYIVSYHSNGNYSASANGFASPVTSGPLTAPSSASSGGNGLYAYGGASAFPTNSYNASNYYVDVVFNGQLAS